MGCVDKGIQLEAVTHVEFSNCTALHCSNEGFWSHSSHIISLSNCQAISNVSVGFKPIYDSYYWTFSSYIARSNGWSGFGIASGGYHTLAACSAEGNGSNGNRGGFRCSVPATFSSCIARYNKGNGIWIEGTVSDVSIKGGIFEGNTQDGINIDGAVRELSITGIRAKSQQNGINATGNYS
jgi:hypothetical protein